MTSGLRMPPGLMRELAAYVTDILVERSRRLADEPAWDGESARRIPSPTADPHALPTGRARRRWPA